jgi:hypothetical protein
MRILFAAAALLVLLVTGCEQGPVTFVPVHGKVFYRGVSLHTGTVVFTPDTLRGNNGPLATADIQADGSFTLRTGAVSGAVPGWHRITVLAVEAPKSGGRPRWLLPEKYSDPELSGLSGEVKAGQANTINLNLD